jgi:hypothetical protein
VYTSVLGSSQKNSLGAALVLSRALHSLSENGATNVLSRELPGFGLRIPDTFLPT